MSTQYYFPPFNAGIQYSQYDVFYDYYIGPNIVYGYATQPSLGQNPNGFFYFPITAYSRVDDVVTVSFTQTGNMANFAAGSQIMVTGVSANTSLNYTGMVIAGGSGYVTYINPGWSQTDNAITVGAINCYNPAWTSGFLFIPSYSSKADVANKAIVAKLGDSYEQRMPQALNTYDKTWNMVFATRTDRETRAIINYIEDSAGVRPFPVVIPVGKLENQPNQKYVGDAVSYTDDSYNVNTVTATIRRVYDL